MASETFAPQGYLRPDFSAASNWSGGVVPGAGTSALVNAVDAYVDPGTTIAASVTLEGGAALVGNGGGFAFAPGATLLATDQDALYGDGAIVNAGIIDVTGTLTIVVQAGEQIAAGYGLAEPSFENIGDVAVSLGGTLDISGTEFSNVGNVVLDDGALVVQGGWVDGGQSGLVPGGGITLTRGGEAVFGDGVRDQSFDFAGPGTILFDDPYDVNAVAVAGFGYRDEILVPSVAAAESLVAGGLTFTTPLPEHYTLAVSRVGTLAEISLRYDAAPPCFARGTRLLTPSGYVPVETLRPGDLVATFGGAARAVRWAGWRSIDLAGHARPDAVRPIRVRAGAIDEFTPARDVVLSPDHALFLRGQLVPVKFLVNGATIIREAVPAVTYFHVELERHDVLLAEGLAVESYIDTGNRHAFEHSAGKPWASPVFGRGRQWDSRAFAPLCTAGPVLRGIRQGVLDRVAALGYRHRIMGEVALLVDGLAIKRDFGTKSLPCFRLPAGHGGVLTIRSAAFVPAEMSCGAGEEEDWRALGLAIRRVKLDLKSVSLGEIARSGVHARAAGDAADWTDGNAVIEIPRATGIIGFNIMALPKAWQAPLGVVG